MDTNNPSYPKQPLLYPDIAPSAPVTVSAPQPSIEKHSNIAPPIPAASKPGTVMQASGERCLLGPENTDTVCQFCRAHVRTAVKHTPTSRTLIASALWGLVCCLCCVPCCADSAKNSDHYCPNCQRYLGTYVK